MKVIFLDVDGVLNFENSSSKVMPEKVKLLSDIVNATGAEIVLSSDWRNWWGTDDEDFLLLERTLKEFRLGLMDKTPITRHGYRGAEIHQWINEWQGEKIKQFAILDDMDDMKPYMDRLIQTKNEYGLTDKDVKNAISLLGG